MKSFSNIITNFANKLHLLVDSIDIIMRSQMMKESRMKPLHQECCELLSIIAKSIITTKTRIGADEIVKLNK